jgi:hypothetical protein
MSNKKKLETAFREGRDAYFKKYAWWENPYKIKSYEYREWKRGWDYALLDDSASYDEE